MRILIISLFALVLLVLTGLLLYSFPNILKDPSRPDNSSNLNESFCTAQEREGQFCTEIYSPVCGWFDSNKIKCIKYPCANTYSNRCFACHEENVKYITQGVCPN